MQLEELRELRGYRRLYATTNLLLLCAYLIWSYFSLDLAHDAIPALAVAAWALFTLAYYSVLPDARFRWRTLFYGNLADLGFATVLIWYSGRESSPFFFMYLLTILGAALTLGLRPCLALAAVASALYVVVGTAAISDVLAASSALTQNILPPVDAAGPAAPDAQGVLTWSNALAAALVHSVSQVWANLAALWLTAYVAGFFAQETRRVRAVVQEAREQAEGFSRIDWLTGLYNRRHFDFLLAQEVARAERYGRPLSLLLVDSDNLKMVNDTYGHQAGDRLLSSLATLFRGDTRLCDTLVRYGGDEFVVLLPETEPVGARFVAERLRAAVEAAGFAWDKTRISVTVTIGVATLPQDAPDAATLIARADAALYVGKRAGRNRVVVAGEAAAPGETLDAPVSATGTLPGPRPSGAAPETADG